MRKLDVSKIQTLIDLAVEEDFGKGDPTSQITIDADAFAKTYVVTRQEIVVCGMEVVCEVLKRYDERLKLEVLIGDGEHATAGERLAVIAGPLRSMLSGERVVLNFLQRLCGISTMTGKFVSAVEGTKAKVYDTRKTTPGWRELEKYAVRCGGGNNHRMHLGDGVMIKDNHVAEMGTELESKLAKMVEEAAAYKDVEFISVEVDHVDGQLDRVLTVGGIDVVLLDNMTLDQMKDAVKMRDEMCGELPLLEATGNVNLTTIKEIAQTGVDRISIGAITHSATAVDIGLDT
jgi:nicotinate-nucleotide pyrophosphorylase (carboxylating)